MLTQYDIKYADDVKLLFGILTMIIKDIVDTNVDDTLTLTVNTCCKSLSSVTSEGIEISTNNKAICLSIANVLLTQLIKSVNLQDVKLVVIETMEELSKNVADSQKTESSNT
jgi:hypothetical protein